MAIKIIVSYDGTENDTDVGSVALIEAFELGRGLRHKRHVQAIQEFGRCRQFRKRPRVSRCQLRAARLQQF